MSPNGEGSPSPLRGSGVGFQPSSQSSHSFLSAKRVTLRVENNFTHVIQAEPFILDVLNKELRYPTAVAHARDAGFLSPEDESGNSWDGWVRLFVVTKTLPPRFPSGLLTQVVRICEKFGYLVVVDDVRQRPEQGFPELVDVPLRDYQKTAVDSAVKSGMGVLDMPPRAGKTRTMVEIVRQIALQTLWIAPTDRIVRQTCRVIEGFLGKNFVTHQVGGAATDAKHTNIVCCTAATAVKLSPDFFQTREVLVVDEWHHAAAKSYKDIFKKAEHIYYRFGMTGTFFRSGDDAMAMHAHLSNTIFKISSTELLARGHVVPTDVCFVPVLSKKLRGVSSDFQTGHGKHGIQEHRERNQHVVHATVILQRMGKKVLVLVGTKKQGRLLKSMLDAFVFNPDGTEFDAVEFVSTDTDRGIQTRIIDAFVQTDEVKVLIGTSLLGEGVDLPTVDALVYARGERAEVTLTQNAYRVCTANEGKERAIIVDFADRHHRKLLGHSMERLRVYNDDPVFNVTVLTEPQEFLKWAQQRP